MKIQKLNDDILEFINDALTNEGLKSFMIKSKIADAKTLYKLFLVNPPKRENISENLSFILENTNLIFFDECEEIIKFDVTQYEENFDK